MQSNSRKYCAAVLTAALLIALFANLTSAAAQTAEPGTELGSGSICVLVFNDTNGNATRDSGEANLSDVAVNVMVGESVIIANHVTDGQEPYCFKDLAAQQYTVGFSSPLYEATTLNSFNLELAAGETRPLEFGAAPKPAPTESADAATVQIPATQPVRIGVSALASIIVMAFVAALGLILFGLFGTKK
jgi:hypothetical protein